MRTIYFDMDGTIANLYSVDKWLDKLRAEDTSPYEEAAAMENMEKICELCEALQNNGIRIGIISWLSKEATKEYKQAVRKAKLNWLEKNFPIIFDELHFIQYGTRKDYVAKDKLGIIFDDDERVRNNWRGLPVNPNEEKISQVLENILKDIL